MTVRVQLEGLEPADGARVHAWTWTERDGLAARGSIHVPTTVLTIRDLLGAGGNAWILDTSGEAEGIEGHVTHADLFVEPDR